MQPTTPGAVTVVLPCLDEAIALPGVLAAVPAQWPVVVVDNGSTDGSQELATSLGARVVTQTRRGYGAAVHTGLEAARTDLVAVLDCDGSVDPQVLVGLAEQVRSGRCDLAVGRRRPTVAGVSPWHARAGNAVLVAIVRRTTGLDVHDIAAVRVARREALLGLGLVDRRFGYPLELLLAAARAGWRVIETPVAYGPRAAGSRSKISGTVRGTLRVATDFATVLRQDRRRHG